MSKKVFEFRKVEPWPGVSVEDWTDWKWQMRSSLKSMQDFAQHFELTEKEVRGFSGQVSQFRVQSTPFYTSLGKGGGFENPVRRIILPLQDELVPGAQQMLDPLGENKQSNRATQRLVHRYTDRALFLATDMCGVYCRYCTRKHFTASDQVMATEKQLAEAVNYVRQHPEIKEIIFSGGDPLTIGNGPLEKMLKAFYEVETLELIRVGSRIPLVNPFRIDDDLISIFQKYKPIYFMTHFNHPDEVTEEAAVALESLVDHGVPVFNQMVLLNGINNHPALVYALSRRLLYLRVKPHYMFQADPSMGTDHLRTSIEDSLAIQKKLWGNASGLAMPTYIVDIPDGGGKAALNPNFITSIEGQKYSFMGWDCVSADYISPPEEKIKSAKVKPQYQEDWLFCLGKTL